MLAIIALNPACRSKDDSDGVEPENLNAIEMLTDSADREQFARAFAPREFSFPRDHGAHPAFRTEWWYLTGNVATSEDRPFGYELTIFRHALVPEAADDAKWRTRDVYLAHLAVSDIAAGEFYAQERSSRGAAGLAGAELDPLRVYVEDWTIAAVSGNDLPWRITARSDDLALDLTLDPGTKSPVLQGERGLSRKSSAPGNASYYYSHTRLPTAGSIVVAGERHAVSGASWLDREWSTSALAEDQAGWDWFALQLDDDREVMFYRLRTHAGEMHDYSAGSLVSAEGDKRPLSAGDVVLEPERYWRNVRGVEYPVEWSLAIPSEGLELRVTPALDDQELDVVFRYWEGAVAVSGTSAGAPVTGVGYLELAGYAAQ